MEKGFTYTADAALVETKEGTLRGFLYNGIYTFHGIPYAQAKRFQAPQRIAPWEGIRDAVNFGPVCPTEETPLPSCELLIPHRFWVSDENCQFLNVWTPGLDEKKRPVMVWFHGGGYSAGSSIEQAAYEGDQLAESGDVVVVTVNHRLNILGYFDLSAYGKPYHNSANAGIADLVTALEWVRDNISGFGGDSNNVTIFGQSGGGAKVQVLMQTPAAAGLFHKAIIMSGVLPMRLNKEPIDFQLIAGKMMDKLSISHREPEKLEQIPYAELVKVFRAVTRELEIHMDWEPIPNDWFLGLPLDTDLTPWARKVPVIVGSTSAEMATMQVLDDRPVSDEEQMRELTERFGVRTDRVLAEYRKAFPEENLKLLSVYDTLFRSAAIAFAEKRAACSGSAPTYMYLFDMKFPIMDGAYAWHCSDIPFVFHNTSKVPYCGVPGAEAVQAEMAGAWVNFARSGDPNSGNMPKWRAYETDKSTMLFDANSRCVPEVDAGLLREMGVPIPFKAE